MKIILDGFGGDNAPLEPLRGARMAVDELAVTMVLTGDEEVLRRTAIENNISLDGIELVPASTVIPVCADSATIMKEYNDSSMAVGMKLLAQGGGDAFISAGSSGALVMGASLIVKRIKGIKRATFAPVIPCVGSTGGYLLTDGGSNIECRPEMLLQFGVMGSIYMNRILHIEKPRVGLINVGTEESKGGALQLAAYQLLKQAPINFIGNVEPRQLPFGACDVAVCDGFSGNIVLKLTEGMASAFSKKFKHILLKNMLTKLGALTIRGGMNDFKKSMDYTEYGGSVMLGATKPTIKAHGSSNAKAFKNAVRQAVGVVKGDVVGEIARGLAEMKAAAEREASI